MSFWTLVVRSFRFHGRVNCVVMLSVMVATAVLTGALLVGDSMKHSLKSLVVERLGRIDRVLVATHFFRDELATEIAANPEFKKHFSEAIGVIFFPNGTVELSEKDAIRTGNVTVLGIDAEFWKLGDQKLSDKSLAGDEIILNQELADHLSVKEGDLVTLRVSKDNQVPGDSPLGDKENLVVSLPRLKLVQIVPNRGLGRFSMTSSQRTPRNAYVSKASLQSVLDLTKQVNAMLIASPDAKRAVSDENATILESALNPKLADYGLAIRRVRRTFKARGATEEQTIFDYFNLTSNRMILDQDVEAVADKAFQGETTQKLFTYLANLIGKTPQDSKVKPIAYSMITAVDSIPSLGPLLDAQGSPIQLAEGEIALSSWSVKDQAAKVGDKITVTYFNPETTHGISAEIKQDFTLKHSIPLTEPISQFTRSRKPRFRERPTIINDPDLTPVVKGITDQQSIDDWETPFELIETRVRRVDDDYWTRHRTTPKAFVSLATGQKLFGSRWGRLTSIRIPHKPSLTAQQLEDRFLKEAHKLGPALGLRLIAVKSKSLKAASGTTPFDGLFFGLSLFIIVAALMLVSLLFRLGMEQRAAEIGTVLAVGFRRRLASWVMIYEGGLVSAIGAALGLLLGIGYAQLMLAGLKTRWVGAIVTPFLEFHWTVQSLLVGYVLGVGASVLTIVWSIRQTKRVSVVQLMAGVASSEMDVVRKSGRLSTILAIASIVIAVALLGFAGSLDGMAQAGAFVGAGTLILTGLLFIFWKLLRGTRDDSSVGMIRRVPLGWLAGRNAGRNPVRSTLTVGLMATACFLIISMSSFQLAPTESGTAGFQLIGESSEPIYVDLNDPKQQRQYLADNAPLMSDGEVLALRMKPGDDASCNNLYAPSQPRVLGVTNHFVDYFAKDGVKFAWAGSKATEEAEKKNPWLLLRGEAAAKDQPVPCVVDMNTAMYSLKWSLGGEYDVEFDGGPKVRFKVVGFLSNSILQGSLLIGEADFKERFKDVSGYRYFLIRSAKEQQTGDLSKAIAGAFSEQGLDVVKSEGVLKQLLEVQNTYLSAFQSLGALGLLLGTIGLATVQIRSVFERRAELALLRAAGFRRARVAMMVLLENFVLLFGGLLTGLIAALLAVLPHMFFGAAAVPWGQLGLFMLVIVVVGVVASLGSVIATLRAPLVAALRGD